MAGVQNTPNAGIRRVTTGNLENFRVLKGTFQDGEWPYPTIPAPAPFSDVAVIVQLTRSFRAKNLMEIPLFVMESLNRRYSEFSDPRSVSRSIIPRQTNLLIVTVVMG